MSVRKGSSQITKSLVQLEQEVKNGLSHKGNQVVGKVLLNHLRILTTV